MKKTVKVGTRKSALAIEQARLAVDAMKAASPELEFELVYKMTTGDRILDRPLLSFGGKGVFVSEFEEALQRGELDFAVHSAKDLPMNLAEGLSIVGIPERGDPRDVLITRAGTILTDRQEIVIGTSSLRRKVQIEGLSEDLWKQIPVRCENLRGNVQTRLGKLEAGEFDAVILAAAGIKRLDLDQSMDYDFHYFDCDTFIPAGGQGILAVEGRTGDPICRIAEKINDRDSVLCLKLERKILRLLDAGCHEPVGIYSYIEGTQMHVSGLYQRGTDLRVARKLGDITSLDILAEEMAAELLE